MKHKIAINIAVLFIFLATLFYLVPSYANNYSSAAVADNDLAASFSIGSDLQEAKVGDFLIVNGKTAKVIDMTFDAVMLENQEKEEIVILMGEEDEIYEITVRLLSIR